MDKKEIRNNILKARDALTTEDVAVKSACIIDKLLRMEAVVTASELYTYVSFRSEVDTIGLIQSAWMSKKKVFVPKIISKGIIEFYQITKLEELVPSKFGILEPTTTRTKAFGEHDDQVMIMPGVAFDHNMHRIGYGGGYYDRYLERYDHGVGKKIAICYDLQMMDEFRSEEHDCNVDVIVTETHQYGSLS